MESFEDHGVSADLVEALASEGIERPTPVQSAAIPVLARGGNLLLAAGPGSGLLVAWSVGLLDRVDAEGDAPRVLVLTSTSEAADRLAESVAALAITTGHSVAALGTRWVLPHRAQILLGTPTDVLSAVSSGDLSLGEVQALVVDQAHLMEGLGGLGGVERVLDYLEADTQRVVSALPVTDGVTDLVERHFRRAVRVPAPYSDPAPKRGEVRFRIVSEPRESGALAVVSELFEAGARHALVFCRSEDRAADVGDYLTLHGFAAGAPGDDAAPVWLGVDALEARAQAAGVDGVVVVSCDVPADPNALDRRHSISEGGVIVVLPREVPHLKSLGRTTGYATVPFPPPVPAAGPAEELRDLLERALEEEDTAPYLSVLEPLFRRHDPVEIAAAAVALLRSKRDRVAPVSEPRAEAGAGAPPAPAWAKLFVGVGERDGLRAGDLLGAIVGEADVRADAVGRIDIKESHSLVEVHDSVAQRVIRALNGTTIKGRAVRADFDRPKRGGGPRRGRSRT